MNEHMIEEWIAFGDWLSKHIESGRIWEVHEGEFAIEMDDDSSEYKSTSEIVSIFMQETGRA
jgi:hypothetical protein